MISSALASPSSQTGQVLSAVNEEEFIRASYLKTESSIKTLGAWFIYSGAILLLFVLIQLAAPLFSGGATSTILTRIAATALTLLFPAALFQTGRQLLKLEPVSRTPAILLSILGLLAFPIGTILNIGILSFLFSKKVRFVLSESYLLAISRTPHLRSRISRTFIVCAIALSLLIAVPVVFALLVPSL